MNVTTANLMQRYTFLFFQPKKQRKNLFEYVFFINFAKDSNLKTYKHGK